MRKHTLLRVTGISLLFSGVALVIHIIARVSLRFAVVLAAVIPGLAFSGLYRELEPAARAWLLRQLKIGLFGGFAATAAYDVTKFILWRYQPVGFNPFEVIHVFGVLLVGGRVAPPLVYTAGAAFHLLNGICFGIAYWMLFGRRWRAAALLWAAFLEVFQLTLYPGWLNIRFYQEFVQVSTLSHLMYGLVLGSACHWLYIRGL